MIQVRELKKSFDGFEALRGLTLTVPKGAVYGLVGPNGAGKSTLIRHLAGVYRQDSGEVLVGGEPVYERTAARSWSAGSRCMRIRRSRRASPTSRTTFSITARRRSAT